MPIGAATAMPISEVTSVPKIIGNAPKAAVTTPDSSTELNHPTDVKNVHGLSTGQRISDLSKKTRTRANNKPTAIATLASVKRRNGSSPLNLDLRYAR